MSTDATDPVPPTLEVVATQADLDAAVLAFEGSLAVRDGKKLAAQTAQDAASAAVAAAAQAEGDLGAARQDVTAKLAEVERLAEELAQ